MLEPPFPHRYEATHPQQTIEALLTPAIKLAGYDFFIAPQDGSLIANIILHWAVQANVLPDYRVSIQLLDEAGQAVVDYTGPVEDGLRPTSTWLKEEWIVDEHPINLPRLTPGRYQLTLTLIDEATGQPATGALILQEVQIP